MTTRSPDVANVFWEPGETLRCLECSGPILPRETSSGETIYHIWFSSNEDCGVNFREISKERLPAFTFYKFCGEECCTRWVVARGGNTDFDAITEETFAIARDLPDDRFVLGGLYMGMPLRSAIAVVNSATNRRFRARDHCGLLIFSSSSNIDYPSNPASMRASEGEDGPLREVRLDADILTKVLSRYEGVEIGIGDLHDWMTTRLKFEPLPSSPLIKSKWLMGCPEPGSRLYMMLEQSDESVIAPANGSIIWLRL
jgi:hypothetical protein